ncbi:hypothetical protein SLA2020_406970 [Shorea laevis]
MSSENGSEAHHQEQHPGAEHSFDGNCEAISEVGWYILGENQQHVGPYALSELRGKCCICSLVDNVMVLLENRWACEIWISCLKTSANVNGWLSV